MAFYHVTPACNLRRILACGLIAKRGDRARSASEYGEAVWLFVGRDGLEYGNRNWIDSTFEETTRLALFRVDVDPSELEIDGIEAACPHDIPPERLTLITRDMSDHAWWEVLPVDAIGAGSVI
jgi:hypothetical protein